MSDNDDHAAWRDALKASQHPPQPVKEEPGTGWFTTAGSIAVGLVALWALYAWPPG